MISIYVGILLAYLIGSIPTALIAGFLIGKVDIRKTGSGNAGATNIYRSFGLKPYIVVLGIDIFKGFAITSWLWLLIDSVYLLPLQMSIILGFSSIIGHIFTIFAKFKGGKGVATAIGMLLAIIPIPLLLGICVYLIVTSITHYVSLGSISFALSLPVICIFAYWWLDILYPLEIYVIVLVLAVLMLFSHRANIGRLIKGNENKTYFFSKGFKND